MSGLRLRQMPHVVHLGAWPQSPLAGRRPASLEGIGLSVSLHPEAWRRIARLGGLPELHLTRRDGRPGCFADGYAALPAARRWGLASGLLTRQTAWEARHWDDEWEAEMVSRHPSRQAALGEAYDPGSVRAVRVLVPSGALALRLLRHFGRLDALSPVGEAELVNRFVLASEPSADGVWWEDKLDPARLSAPRGLILPERLAAWQVLPSS